MSFDEDENQGEISFLGDGRVEGWIEFSGRHEFWGWRVEGSERGAMGAAAMGEEWEGYNEDEYERERVGRWGGWGW